MGGDIQDDVEDVMVDYKSVEQRSQFFLCGVRQTFFLSFMDMDNSPPKDDQNAIQNAVFTESVLEDCARPSAASELSERSHEPETGELAMKSIPEQPSPPERNQQTHKPHFKLKYTLSGHTMSISSLKFSPDGSMLASSGVFASPLSWQL